MKDVPIVVGRGDSSIAAVNMAASTSEAWDLAEGVGLDVSERHGAGSFCVVIAIDAATPEQLDADPAVVMYDRLPVGSAGHAAWLASVSP